MGKFIDEQMFKGVTEIQRERNELIKCHCESEHFIKFIQDAYQHVRNLFDTFHIPPKKSKCNWCILCAKIQDHLTCTHYNAQCMKAFNTAELLPNIKAVCSKIYMDILAKIAHDEVSSLKCEDRSSQDENNCDLSLPEQNTLCYVAGATIHKMTSELHQSLACRMIECRIVKLITVHCNLLES